MALTQYKGIEVNVPRIKVTDEDIEQQLTALLNQYPAKVSKEGPAEEGDTCAIDYKGMKEGIPFEGGTGSYDLQLGSGSFIPGFEEKMIGMVKGETRDLELTFPAEYHAPELAGASVVFTVTVNDIFTQAPAEMNDEFVAQFNIPNVNTVENMRDFMAQQLEMQANQQNMQVVLEAVMGSLIENAEIEVAEERIVKAIEVQMSQLEMNMQQQGISLDQYLELTGGNRDVLAMQLRPDAEKQARLEAILLEIAELEGLSVSDEELEKFYSGIAESNQVPVEKVKADISSDILTGDLLRRKAHEVVMANAVINYTE